LIGSCNAAFREFLKTTAKRWYRYPGFAYLRQAGKVRILRSLRSPAWAT